MHDYMSPRSTLTERIAFFTAWVESQIAYQELPGREHVFRISATQGFGQDGEYAVFEFDPAGQLARLKVGDNYRGHR